MNIGSVRWVRVAVTPQALSPALTFSCIRSTLAVTRITSEDEAIYQCIAENSAGTNQASARLAVSPATELPEAPRDLVATALSTTALQLSWAQPALEVTDGIIGYVLHIRKLGGEDGERGLGGGSLGVLLYFTTC